MMSEWNEVRLGDLCTFVSRGITPQYVDEGILVINQKCIRDNKVDLSLCKFTSPTQKIKREKFVQYGDVLVNSTGTGTLGRVATYKHHLDRVSADGHVTILHAKCDVDSLYLGYYLHSVEPLIENLGRGTTNQLELSPSDLKRIKIVLPDLPTQKRIADILSTYDELIENNNRRIALLEKAAQELYKEWFVRFRFPGHETTKFENGLPVGWDVAKLGSILILEDTKRVPLSEQQRSGMQPIYPYYGACSIAGYVDKYIFDGVYLLLSEDGANVVDENGYPTLQYVWGKFWVNNHAHIISKNDVYSVEFLHLLLKNTNMQSIVTGAAQPKISQKRLLNKKVIVPDSKIIQLFSARIDPIYKVIRYITESNRNIEKQRDLLLPRLMSGKLEVYK